MTKRNAIIPLEDIFIPNNEIIANVTIKSVIAVNITAIEGIKVLNVIATTTAIKINAKSNTITNCL